MLYPTIQGVDLNLFGMTVNATYTSTFLPVVFTMAIAIPLYKWLEKRVSKLVKSFMVPAIALAVAVPLGFSLVGPAANMVGNALNVVLTVIFDTVPLVAFIIFGGLYQVFVLFGIHGAICMVPFMELLQGHPVRMLVCTLIPCFAQTGVVLAVCLKTKDKKLKDFGAGPVVHAHEPKHGIDGDRADGAAVLLCALLQRIQNGCGVLAVETACDVHEEARGRPV